MKRFLEAQKNTYSTALQEIKEGKKISHWMWYIFPQIKGLGESEISKFYAIKDIEEAKIYLKNPILKKRLYEICTKLLKHKDKKVSDIFGFPDDMKLQSSMTLFSLVAESEENIFTEILKVFFNGEKDKKTLEILKMK